MSPCLSGGTWDREHWTRWGRNRGSLLNFAVFFSLGGVDLSAGGVAVCWWLCVFGLAWEVGQTTWRVARVCTECAWLLREGTRHERLFLSLVVECGGSLDSATTFRWLDGVFLDHVWFLALCVGRDWSTPGGGGRYWTKRCPVFISFYFQCLFSPCPPGFFVLKALSLCSWYFRSVAGIIIVKLEEWN